MSRRNEKRSIGSCTIPRSWLAIERCMVARNLRFLILPAFIAMVAALVSVVFAGSIRADRTVPNRLGSSPLIGGCGLATIHGRAVPGHSTGEAVPNTTCEDISVVHGRNNAPFASLAGNWSGTWTDTRYNVSGTLSASFTVNGSTVNATGVIGLESLGLGNESGTGVGTVSGQTLNFTFSASTVGNGSGTLSAAGAGNGTGTVTGTLDFGAFTYSGTVAGDSISGNFAFTSPTGGKGVASLTKH
jgi:hypothetical protein